MVLLAEATIRFSNRANRDKCARASYHRLKTSMVNYVTVANDRPVPGR